MLGLLAGQVVGNVAQAEFLWWQKGLYGVTSVTLFILLFLMNAATKYMCFLIDRNGDEKSRFLDKLEQMHWSWRAAIGLFSSMLIFR